MSVWARAMRSLSPGSSRASGLTARARLIMASRSARMLMARPAVSPPLCPSGALATDHPLVPEAVGDRDAGAGEEHLVEHLLAGDVPQGPALDAVGLHVDDERGDPLVLRLPLEGGGIRTHQEEAPLG